MNDEQRKLKNALAKAYIFNDDEGYWLEIGLATFGPYDTWEQAEEVAMDIADALNHFVK
jgi:hypothetical protein